MRNYVIALSVLGALTLSVPAMANNTAPAAPAHKTVKPTTAAHHKMAAKHRVHASVMVKNAQEALNKHGAKLKADGFMGAKTRTAIRNFQKANGLKPTGLLTKETMKKLEAK